MVTLRREVDHLQSYVRLQHVRFPDRFCIEIDVPEELQTLVVPKMILQPLAENFFKHGFERDGSSTANRFLLRIRQIGPELVVHCENSGQKIPNNQLEALQERMEQTTELRYGAEGTGLKNIRDRLMLNYKREAEFMLATPETGGFRIVMRFPAVKEADAS